MNELIESLERRQLRREVPGLETGDRVRVHFQVVEGSRRRTQIFEGIVMKLQGSGSGRTFTVRKLSFGVGVERTFPLHSPRVERIEILARGEVRRAKLYYLRGRVGRRAKVRERRDVGAEELMAPLAPADEFGEQEEVVPLVEEEAATEEGTEVAEAGSGEPEQAGTDDAGETPQAADEPAAGNSEDGEAEQAAEAEEKDQ